MIKRYLHSIRTFMPSQEDEAEAIKNLKDTLPRSTARRMSNLGVILHTLFPEDFDEEDALIYATSFAESRSLEKFLESFPMASPMHFQTSIHPSAVEQALIARGQSVRNFHPLAGNSGILSSACFLAMTVPSKHSHLMAGEETGGWLSDIGLASKQTWGFACKLSQNDDGANAILHWQPSAPTNTTDSEQPISLMTFCDHLHRKRPFKWGCSNRGSFILEWKG